MGEPKKRISRGEVENIRYSYRSASRSGRTTSSVNIRSNRTAAETERQIKRIRENYPGAFTDNEHGAYSTVLRTYDALGLTRRAERPANTRLLSRKSLPKRNR